MSPELGRIFTISTLPARIAAAAEVALVPWRRSRLAYAFRFLGVPD